MTTYNMKNFAIVRKGKQIGNFQVLTIKDKKKVEIEYDLSMNEESK